MSSPIALQELFKAGFEDFVIPSYETAPFTTIQNRAQVTRSLKAIAGVERVMFGNTLNLLQNEFGPNGERVYSLGSGDSRFRAVGNWYNQSASTGGNLVVTTNTINDFVEITFYGTGLNAVMYESGSVRDYRASIDGGAEGSNLKPSASFSGILTGRSYAVNHPIPVVSGLSLGWHTVKIRNNDASNGPSFYGFEILNQRTDLAVYAGAGISNGSFNGLSSLATSAFNQGVTGTRGARVVKYIENGTLKSAVQEVDSTAKYLTLSDHTNEEIVRRINFREFGANRADDFSTMTTGLDSNAFTLDDGTTTLVCSNGNTGSSSTGMWPGTTAAFFTLTFVGTGIDFIRSDSAGATIDSHDVTIDGVGVGTLTGAGSSVERLQKISSGLPYGTHTLKIARPSAVNAAVGVVDFIIYQPKKPSIPVGALEVADYNLMGNYSFNSSTGPAVISSSVVRKLLTREAVYSGSWTANAVDPLNHASGFGMTTLAAGAYVEYTFWGTGFELMFYTAPAYGTSTVSVDGLTATATNFPSATFSVTSPATYNTTSGVLASNVTDGPGRRLSMSGLSLGVHKVRITNNAATNLNVNALDIITPIHINNSNLKVGSQSLKSVVKYSPEKSVSNAGPDLSKAKAWVMFDGLNNKIISSYNISAVLVAASITDIRIYFQKQFKTEPLILASGSGGGVIQLYGIVDISSTGLTSKIHGVSLRSVSNSNLWAMAAFGELIDE
jgi:hypothetical protein